MYLNAITICAEQESLHLGCLTTHSLQGTAQEEKVAPLITSSSPYWALSIKIWVERFLSSHPTIISSSVLFLLVETRILAGSYDSTQLCQDLPSAQVVKCTRWSSFCFLMQQLFRSKPQAPSFLSMLLWIKFPTLIFSLNSLVFPLL